MILVDSSVWIDFLRGRQASHVDKLVRAIVSQEVLTGDLIVCEVLRGCRTEREAQHVGQRLQAFACMALVGRDIALLAARNFRLLRQRGITIRTAVDLLIGTFCIERNLPLLHADRDFEPMAEHLGLVTL